MLKSWQLRIMLLNVETNHIRPLGVKNYDLLTKQNLDND